MIDLTIRENRDQVRDAVDAFITQRRELNAAELIHIQELGKAATDKLLSRMRADAAPFRNT